MDKEIFFQIKKVAGRLKKDYNAEQVILFGSYAIGEEGMDTILFGMIWHDSCM